jgi:hypothetical protein
VVIQGGRGSTWGVNVEKIFLLPESAAFAYTIMNLKKMLDFLILKVCVEKRDYLRFQNEYVLANSLKNSINNSLDAEPNRVISAAIRDKIKKLYNMINFLALLGIDPKQTLKALNGILYKKKIIWSTL